MVLVNHFLAAGVLYNLNLAFVIYILDILTFLENDNLTSREARNELFGNVDYTSLIHRFVASFLLKGILNKTKDINMHNWTF